MLFLYLRVMYWILKNVIHNTLMSAASNTLVVFCFSCFGLAQFLQVSYAAFHATSIFLTEYTLIFTNWLSIKAYTLTSVDLCSTNQNIVLNQSSVTNSHNMGPKSHNPVDPRSVSTIQDWIFLFFKKLNTALYRSPGYSETLKSVCPAQFPNDHI